jgi:hypothetical protein|tara:strand:+ start:269 stop:514 length:246 start_codon:yes stop_codon:yes gene_type:complete
MATQKLRGFLLRGTQMFLGLDGLLHLAEFGAALIEEAWVTATLTGTHALVFFLGVYFIGHDHIHHQLPSHTHDSTWDRTRD